MQPTQVSIIMPVYNGEKYISEAIRSVINQSFTAWELIVVDDGSTDKTTLIVKSFNDSRVKYFFQHNRGQAAALNFGLAISSGDFVTTLDSDDWLPENSIHVRVAYLNENPEIGVVYGDGNYCKEDGSIITSFSRQMPNGLSGNVYGKLIVSPFYGTGASVLVRRKMLDVYQIQYDEELVWCQDWDFYIKLAEVTPFGYVASSTINYRIHSEGMTVAMPPGRRLDSLVRLRLQVSNSSCFRFLDETKKYEFYYDFLVRNLDGKIKEQEKVINSASFYELSPHIQSKLLRSFVFNYIIRREEHKSIRKWLYTTWIKKPIDLKITLAAVLFALSPELARIVIVLWQGRHTTDVSKSPFELLTSPK